MDRAALDAALDLGFPCGGFCPKGRLAEDGPIEARYPLVETPSEDYEERTEWNVRDSDGTLILKRGDLKGGTALTHRLAVHWRKPVLVLNVDESPSLESVRGWIKENGIETLNVAGPRESLQPGIYSASKTFLSNLFTSF